MELSSAPAQATSSPEADLHHYQIVRCLGQGGYGAVYEAWDRQLQRKVAIKRLHTLPLAAFRDGLLREARLAASLDHPAFVRILSIEPDGAGHAIVMELIPGATLRELAAGASLPPADAVAMVLALAEAMHAAHTAGLVHGDLKPSNLMRQPNGAIRILDLGLAFHDDPQATSSVLELEGQGTIAYLAPECLLGAAPSRHSDIYALGVVLYELLCGARPFAELSGLALAAALMQTSSAHWPLPERLDPALVALVRAATARRPEERPDSMAALALCLRAPGVSTRLQPSLASAPGWRRLARALAQRRTLLRRSLAVLALGAIVLAASVWGPALAPRLAPFSVARTLAHGNTQLQQFQVAARLGQAEHDFQQVLEREPENAAAAAGLSLVYSLRYASHLRDETWLRRAQASVQLALRLGPELALTHAADAWVQAGQGQPAAALVACERSLALEPDNFFGSLGKAIFLTKLGRYGQAAEWIMAAQRRYPQEPAFSDALGTIHFQQGHYAEAEQAFRRSIAIQPDSSVAYANLNAALLRLNRSAEALAVLQQGLQLSPTANLYTSLGNALFSRGDYTGAARAFEQAVTPPVGNPNNSLYWANLADALQWIPGQSEAARHAYRQAIGLLERPLQRSPDDATLLSRMALYQARLGEAAHAEEALQHAARKAPTNPDLHFRATLAYELLGKREAALSELALAKRYGYPAASIASEPDLVALRRDRRYQQLYPPGDPP